MAHDYAFDMRLRTVARVRARTPEEALRIILLTMDAASVDFRVDGDGGRVCCREISHDHDEADPPSLFEVDGNEVGPSTQ